MVSNNGFKKSHEMAVLDDVLSFCRARGGYRKKQADKLVGAIDSEHERPDLAIVHNDGLVIGLEHFRADHHVARGRKAESKAARFDGQLEKEREALSGVYDRNDEDRLLDEFACIIGNGIARYMKDRNDACCDDLAFSLSKRLFDKKNGHARKLPAYKSNLLSRCGDASKIEFGYLIEIHSDFRGLFLTDRRGTKRLRAGECPLFEGVYDPLALAAENVDWILLAFYPSIGSGLVDAGIIDCRNGMFKESCARQGLSRTMYLGLGKDEPSRKQTKPGSAAIEMVDDRYEISIETDVEEFDLKHLWNKTITDTALALNLRKREEPFMATISVQMLYETLLVESKRTRDEITRQTVLAALGKMSYSEAMARMEAFGERYGISHED